MTDIFISYKREDEARVARLVKALEGAGLAVWWDRALPYAEGWRGNIEAALDAAKVVVVCWTRGSVDAEAGRFVRAEAARAGRKLVQVKLDRGLRLPLPFSEDQAIDLSHWRGNARDPFFQDLVALLIAKRDGAPAPKPKGPAARALKRFVYGGGLATAVLALAGFVWSTPAVREGACALPVPGLSGACCQAGFTEKPIVRDAAYTPAPLEKIGYLRQSSAPFPSEAAARADAAVRLTDDAAALCAVGDAAFERLAGAAAEITRHDCREIADGWVCAADYRATCAVERRERVQRCPG